MILRSLALLAPLAAAALAQTSPAPADRAPGRGGPAFRGHPLVRVMDLDTDGDGSLSSAELHPHRGGPRRPAHAGAPAADQRPGRPAGESRRGPAAHAGTPRAHPSDLVMLALDANEDGVLAAAELANATRSLGALDGNQDGQLTPDELRPLPPTS